MRYKDLKNRIFDLKNYLDFFLLGQSLYGEEILGFHVGKYEGNQILLTGGIHAREYISSLFLIEEAKFLAYEKLFGGFYIIPLLNPDGARLVLDGLDFVRDEKLKNFLIDVNGGKDFSLWKANLNAVDLNVNFDANWAEGRQNLRVLSSENFVGYFPNSEIENINITRFLQTTDISVSIAFHSKGEVIYFGNKAETRLAKILAKECEYTAIKSTYSTGGLSDYIRQKLKKPSFTVELGSDDIPHPISEAQLPKIFERCKTLPLVLLKEV